jgi:hypothetical protein
MKSARLRRVFSVFEMRAGFVNRASRLKGAPLDGRNLGVVLNRLRLSA